jgi:GT2 family glycosyltransferase
MMKKINTDYPMVSIVTINYNGVKVTSELLESLRKVTYPNMEVIVVDNASKEIPDSLKENFPEIVLVKSKENLGFAGGNNEGFKVAKGKYFLMLNNDTEVDPDFLQPLVEKMESDQSVGAVSPKLIYFGTDNIIQYAGCSEINPYTGRSNFYGNKKKDDGSYNCCSQTHYAHGAAMMIRRSIIEEIGMMADLYFLYYEELDFCERIKNAGYSIWYVGESEVYHKESMTVGKDNPLKTYYMTRNRLVFMRRNVKGSKLLISLLFFSFFSIPKNSLVHLKNKRFDLLEALFKGYFWNWNNHKIFDNPKLEKKW